MDKPQTTDRLWTLPYILLILMGTFTSTAFYMVNPSMAKFSISLGATVTLAGVITGMFSITALVARPVSGLIADRVNRKLLLIISVYIMGLAALGYAFARSIPMLVALRIVHGVAFSINSTVNVTMIANLIPRSRMSEGVGYYGLVNIFATAFGPSLGIELGDRFGFSVSFAISAGIIFTGAMMGFLIQPSPLHTNTSKQKSIHFSDLISFKVLPIAIMAGIFSMSNGIITSYMALVGEVRGITGVGMYFTVNALVLLFVRPLAGKLADRKGPKLIVYPAMLLDGIALFLIGRAQSLGTILTAAVCKAIGQGSGQPALQAEALKTLPPEKSGVASSTFYIGADVGQGLGPMLAGSLVDVCGADSQGYGIMFSCAAGVFLLGMIAYTIYSQKRAQAATFN